MHAAVRHITDTAGIGLHIDGAACDYLASLGGNHAVYVLSDVDGAVSPDGWVAFAFPEHLFRVTTRPPLITHLAGIKVVIADAQHAAALAGRTLSVRCGKLVLEAPDLHVAQA